MAKGLTDDSHYKAISNAIRALHGGTETYTPAEMGQYLATQGTELKSANVKKGITIFGVEGAYEGEKPKLQSKTVTPSKFPDYVRPDDGFDGLNLVTLNADSNLAAGNIRNGKTIFGVTGSYESKMQAGEAISRASDYYLPLTEEGALGFNQVLVKGDANLIGENIKAGVSILNVLGTYEGGGGEGDGDGSYDEGYQDGYDKGYADGYAAGVASGGGGDEPDVPDVPDEPITADFYLYGTPSESGNVAIAEGDGYVRYRGEVYSNIDKVWDKEKYPYAYIWNAYGDWLYLCESLEYSYNKYGSLTISAQEAYNYNSEENKWIKNTGTPPFTPSIEGTVCWANFEMVDENGVAYFPPTAPIPLVSNEPIRYEGDIPVYEKKE